MTNELLARIDILNNENKQLKEELKSANEEITWWSNRFNAVERDNRQLKEYIKKLEEGLFMCNALKEDYKKCNSDAVEWVKTNLRFLPTSKELLKILLTTNLKKENK